MNKLVVITGGTRGIGVALSEKFCIEGYDVVATVVNNSTFAQDVKKKLETKYNNTVHILELNVGSDESVEQFITELKNLDRPIDALINNAGITNDKLTGRMSVQDFTDVLNVNLTGTFRVTKPILKIMSKQKHGAVINMSSVVGITGNLGQANYSASKAGVIGLTKSLSKEFARKSIRINAIAPGFIKTAMTDELGEKIIETVTAQTDLKRLGEPEEIANVAYFLASEQSSYITGQVIVVDGGLT